MQIDEKKPLKVWERNGKKYVYTDHWIELEEPTPPVPPTPTPEVTAIQVFGGTEKTITQGRGQYLYLAVQPDSASNKSLTIVPEGGVSVSNVYDIHLERDGVIYNKQLVVVGESVGVGQLNITSVDNPNVSVVVNYTIQEYVQVQEITNLDEIDSTINLVADNNYTYIEIDYSPSNATNPTSEITFDPVDPNNDYVYYTWGWEEDTLFLCLRTPEAGDAYYNININGVNQKTVEVIATMPL